MVTTRPPKTIVKPTALGPVANTDTKLLIYGLFQKGRVLAQDGVADGAGWSYPVSVKGGSAFGGNPQTEKPVEIQEVASFLEFLPTRTRGSSSFAIRLFSVLSGFNHDAHVVLSDSPTVI